MLNGLFGRSQRGSASEQVAEATTAKTPAESPRTQDGFVPLNAPEGYRWSSRWQQHVSRRGQSLPDINISYQETPYVPDNMAGQQMENWNKLRPWEQKVMNALPGVAQKFQDSALGKFVGESLVSADKDFNSTFLGKILYALDIPFEALERTSGLVAQQNWLMNHGIDWTEGLSQAERHEITKDMFVAGQFLTDFTNLPEREFVGGEWTGRIIMDKDLPGVAGVVEAQRMITELRKGGMSRKDAVEEVRKAIYEEHGALSFRMQMQDLGSRILLDPLNWVLPAVKPVQRIQKAAAETLLSKLPREGLEQLLKSVRYVDGKWMGYTSDYWRIRKAFEAAEESGRIMGSFDKMAVYLTGGLENHLRLLEEMGAATPELLDLYRANKGAWWAGNSVQNLADSKIPILRGLAKQFTLTPEARANEMLSVLRRGLDTHLAGQDTAEGMLRYLTSIADNTFAPEYAHMIMSIEGQVIQSAVKKYMDDVVRPIFNSYNQVKNEVELMQVLARLFDDPLITSQKLIDDIFTDGFGATVKRLQKAGMNSAQEAFLRESKDTLKRVYDSWALDDMAEFIPGSADQLKYTLRMGLSSAIEGSAVEAFGVQSQQLFRKIANAMKAGETLAFLRMNPGYPVRNAINNTFTMLGRRLNPWIRQDKLDDLWRKLGDLPYRAGEGVGMSGETLGKGAISGRYFPGQRILQKLKGEETSLDEMRRVVNDLNLGAFDMGEVSRKIERRASERAFYGGYMQGMRTFWKPGVGFTSVRNGLPAEILAKMSDKQIDALENAVKSYGNTHTFDLNNIDEVTDSSIIFHQIKSEVESVTGFKMEDVFPDGFIDTFQDGLQEAFTAARQENNPTRLTEFFVDTRLKNQVRMNDLTEARSELRKAYASQLLQGEQHVAITTMMADTIDDWIYQQIGHNMRMLGVDPTKLAPKQRRAFWDTVLKESMESWKRHFSRVEDDFAGFIDVISSNSKLNIDTDLLNGLVKEYGSAWDGYFDFRMKKYEELFTALDERKNTALTFEGIQKAMKPQYKAAAKKELEILERLDNELVAIISQQDDAAGRLMAKWRKAAREDRKSLREATRKFLDDVQAESDFLERHKMWKRFQADSVANMQKIQGNERKGLLALYGDHGAARTLAKIDAYNEAVAKAIANKFKFPLTTPKMATQATKVFAHADASEDALRAIAGLQDIAKTADNIDLEDVRNIALLMPDGKILVHESGPIGIAKDFDNLPSNFDEYGFMFFENTEAMEINAQITVLDFSSATGNPTTEQVEAIAKLSERTKLPIDVGYDAPDGTRGITDIEELRKVAVPVEELESTVEYVAGHVPTDSHLVGLVNEYLRGEYNGLGAETRKVLEKMGYDVDGLAGMPRPNYPKYRVPHNETAEAMANSQYWTSVFDVTKPEDVEDLLFIGPSGSLLAGPEHEVVMEGLFPKAMFADYPAGYRDGLYKFSEDTGSLFVEANFDPDIDGGVYVRIIGDGDAPTDLQAETIEELLQQIDTFPGEKPKIGIEFGKRGSPSATFTHKDDIPAKLKAIQYDTTATRPPSHQYADIKELDNPVIVAEALAQRAVYDGAELPEGVLVERAMEPLEDYWKKAGEKALDRVADETYLGKEVFYLRVDPEDAWLYDSIMKGQTAELGDVVDDVLVRHPSELSGDPGHIFKIEVYTGHKAKFPFASESRPKFDDFLDKVQSTSNRWSRADVVRNKNAISVLDPNSGDEVAKWTFKEVSKPPVVQTRSGQPIPHKANYIVEAEYTDVDALMEVADTLENVGSEFAANYWMKVPAGMTVKEAEQLFPGFVRSKDRWIRMGRPDYIDTKTGSALVRSLTEKICADSDFMIKKATSGIQHITYAPGGERRFVIELGPLPFDMNELVDGSNEMISTVSVGWYKLKKDISIEEMQDVFERVMKIANEEGFIVNFQAGAFSTAIKHIDETNIDAETERLVRTYNYLVKRYKRKGETFVSVDELQARYLRLPRERVHTDVDVPSLNQWNVTGYYPAVTGKDGATHSSLQMYQQARHDLISGRKSFDEATQGFPTWLKRQLKEDAEVELLKSAKSSGKPIERTVSMKALFGAEAEAPIPMRPDIRNLLGQGGPPIDEVHEAAYAANGGMMIDQLQAQAMAGFDAPSVNFGNLNKADNVKVNKYLNTVRGDFMASSGSARKYAEFRRDMALLNYKERFHYDNTIDLFAPYAFWMTHSMQKWALSSLDNPAMLTTYMRMRKGLETMGAPKQGVPSRLMRSIKIPLFNPPAWLGDKYFINPMNLMLPFDQMLYPWEQLEQRADNDTRRAEEAIREMVQSGMITAEQGQEAVQMQSGQAWDRAVSIAESSPSRDDNYDIANIFASFHAPLTWGYKAITGQKEDIGPITPMGRNMKKLYGLFGINPVVEKEGFGSIYWTVNSSIREQLGLHPFDKWEDYRIDRALSSMVAQGELSSHEVMRVMLERDPNNPFFMEAARRAAEQYARGSVRGEATLGEKASSVAAFLANVVGLPVFTYPEGESIQRQLTDDFGRAYEAYEDGDLYALRQFFDTNPEYESRLALWKEPQERMQSFLVDEIWSRWNQMPTVHRRQVEEVLGQRFVNGIVNKETRNYSAFSPDELGVFLKIMGGDPPGTLGDDAIGIEFAPEEVAYQVDAFYSARRNMFPNYISLQNIYFDLDDDARKKFLADNTELRTYWAWRDDFFHRNPGILPYVDDDYELRYKSEGQRERAYTRQPTMSRTEWGWAIGSSFVDIATRIYNGEYVPDDVVKMLQDKAEQFGMSYDQFLVDVAISK